MIRGLHATLYGQLVSDVSTTRSANAYRNESFVDVLPFGSHPETRSVRSANACQIAAHLPQGGSTVVVLSVIDNHVKGAAGQAVQNMNVMFGFQESAGLWQLPVLP